jgi:hypothetical protein
LPIGPKPDQFRVDQNLEMLRHGRLRQSDPPDQILDAATVRRSKIPEQPQAHRMSQCRKLARHSRVSVRVVSRLSLHR